MPYTSRMPRVFITGIGFITSIGNDAGVVEQSLRELRHGMMLYPPFQSPGVPVKVAAPVRDFQVDAEDPEDWVLPARYRLRREVLRSLGPGSLFAHCALQQAIEDARLGEGDVSDARTGLYAASAGSPAISSALTLTTTNTTASTISPGTRSTSRTATRCWSAPPAPMA